MKYLEKEKLKSITKIASHYLIIGVSLFLGYIIGYVVGAVIETTPHPINHYSNLKSSKDISIAVDEDDKLLLIDKNTGTYQIYSDSIGKEVYRIYSNRLYQKVYE